MTRLALALAMALCPFAGGCTAIGFCCGRASDFDETTRSDRREVKKEIAEEKQERLEEAAEDFLDDAEEREKDGLDAYYAYVVKELDLAAIWQSNKARPEIVRAWRLTTFDGAFGDHGGFAGARLVAVPDWSWLVTAGLKAKFEDELPGRHRDRLARDLWRGERWAIAHLDAGIPGVDVQLSIDVAPGKQILGIARTDLEGRAALTLPSDAIPSVAPSTVELTALLATTPSHARPLEHDEPGHFGVRRGGGKPVLLVDAEQLLDWTRDASRRAMLEGRWIAKDYCVKDALAEISKTHVVAAVSSQPDALVTTFREGLSASGALGKHSRSVALHFVAGRGAETSDTLRTDHASALADAYRKALGDGSVAGLVSGDAAVADAFAKRTGLKAWTLAAPKDGGWCAGLPALLPPRP